MINLAGDPDATLEAQLELQRANIEAKVFG